MNRSSGNSVADFEEVQLKCSKCDGTGVVAVDRAGLDRKIVDIMDDYEGAFMDSSAEVEEVTKEWERTGNINCLECGGRGRWTERR